MLHSAATLDTADFRRLARLHESTMPTSVFARTGADLLARYYQWIVTSPLEHLFVVKHDGRVAGAAVLSLAPSSLLRRFAMQTPAAFSIAVLKRFLRDAVFRGELAAFVRERIGGNQTDEAVPELVQIFVDPAERRRSIGSDLLAQVTEAVKGRGIPSYRARTLLNDTGGVVEFYTRRGFRPEREVRFCGVPYILLKYPTADSAR
jgi:GNAT superfamily N-acetyltransferase